MIVGVNLRSLRIEGGGARHFAESLLLEFAAPPYSSRLLLLLMCLPDLRAHLERLFTAASNVVIIDAQNESDVVRCQDLFDLYFCPLNALAPVLPRRPSVAVLHDIQEQFFPEFFSAKDLEVRAVLYPNLLHKSTYACTVSQFCADTFTEKLHADPGRVRAVRSFPQKRLVEATAEPPEDCPAAFMLYPANWYRHKNVKNLLTGYVQAKRTRQDIPDLVLVGHPLGQEGLLTQLALTGQETRCIRLYTEISPENLRGLYERSKFVVLPTLFEGYCMPLAEAIIFGRPVLANDLPVLHEIGGDWPTFARLGTPDEIASAILAMDASTGLSADAELPPALKEWGWSKMAMEYETIFHQALIRHRIECASP